jgi:hypothetical protein
VPLRPILISSSYLSLRFPSGVFSSDFPKKILYAFLKSINHYTHRHVTSCLNCPLAFYTLGFKYFPGPVKRLFQTHTHTQIYIRSRGSSVGIGGWTIGVPFPAGAGNFFLHHRVQTGSGAHPVSYLIGTGGSFPGGEAAET